MKFYQVKIIRKRSKPLIWRRCIVPAGITFAQMASVMEDILEYEESDLYEFEFFQKKIQIREWKEDISPIRKFSFDYKASSDTFVDAFMDTENWFTFRINDEASELPEYRVEVEKKISDIKAKDDKEINFPAILKERITELETIWSDGKALNEMLENRYRLIEGEKDYRTFNELRADLKDGKGLVLTDSPVNREEHNKKSANTLMKELTENILNLVSQNSSSSMYDMRQGRNPKMLDYLMTYDKEDIEEKAKEFQLFNEGMNKKDLALAIIEYALSPDGMKNILLHTDEWETETFEKYLEKKCFEPEEEDWIKLGWLADSGYVVCYSDNHAEIPEEVISLYKEVSTPEFQKLCRQVRWMNCCTMIAGFLYAVAPLKIVYRIYRRRPEYKVSYEEFLEILKQVPEDARDYVIQEDKMILDSALTDRVYENIEEMQGDSEFYIPNPNEVLDYVGHGYLSEEPVYKELKSFLTNNLHMKWRQCEEVMCFVYSNFSSGGMISDIMSYLNDEKIIFDSVTSAEKFTSILMRANNNTRMVCFRGYTPNEFSERRRISEPSVPNFFPMGSAAESAKTIVPANSAAKKIYPNDPCPCGSGKKYKKCCGRNK